MDDGAILGAPVIPTGPRLDDSPLDNFGGAGALAANAGLYSGDATDTTTPIIIDTGADRPSGGAITTFTDTVGVVVDMSGLATIAGVNPANSTLSYLYDDTTDSFSLIDASAVPEVSGTNSLLEFFDSDGALFAYVDETGAIWIIDDIDDAPNGQRDLAEPVASEDEVEDDWLLEGTVAANGAAAVGAPFRSLRGRDLLE